MNWPTSVQKLSRAMMNLLRPSLLPNEHLPAHHQAAAISGFAA
jgi:hypothetical protein